MDNKHMNRGSSLLLIRERHMKPSGSHYMPASVAEIKQASVPSAGEGGEKNGSHTGSLTILDPLWKTLWQFPLK